MWIARILRWFLTAFGALCLLAILLGAGYAWYSHGPSNRNKVDAATPQDVRFILKRCGLDAHSIVRVDHSFVSSRSLTGDHVDAYAVKVTHLDLAKVAIAASRDHRWYRTDRVPDVVADAVELAATWPAVEGVSWFPPQATLLSNRMFVCPVSLYFDEMNLISADLIFVRPEDDMLFYLSFKT